jgi:Rod binding domain-containing protein
MDAIGPIAPLSSASTLDLNPPRHVQQAGQQFEALLISQVLKMTHGEDGGWLGSGEDSASSCAMGIAEESLAQSLAAQGGFGLAPLVTKSLNAASPPD